MIERVRQLAESNWLQVLGRITMLVGVPVIGLLMTFGGLYANSRFDNVNQKIEQVETQVNAGAVSRSTLSTVIDQTKTDLAVLNSLRTTDRKSIDQLSLDINTKFDKLIDKVSELSQKVSALTALSDRQSSFGR